MPTDAAPAPVRAVSTWVSGHRFVATTGSGHALVLDNPKHAQGAAASPMELVLAAAGACTGIDVVGMLEKMRQPLARLEVEVEGTRRREPPCVYDRLTLVYRAWGDGLAPDKLLRAVQLSERTYCSVTAMLQHTATVSTRVELNGERLQPDVEA